MPIYEFKCFECLITIEELLSREDFDKGRLPKCPGCGYSMTHAFPRASITGHRKGPGSKTWGNHFNRVDTLVETSKVARQMEDSGKLKGNRKLEKQLQTTINFYKNLPETARQVNYDKEGHPLDKR